MRITPSRQLIQESNKYKNDMVDLICAISFADRSYHSIRTIITQYQIRECWLIDFTNYQQSLLNISSLDVKDKETIRKYQQNKRLIQQLLNSFGIEFSIISLNLYQYHKFRQVIHECSFSYPLIVDLSCIPKYCALITLDIIDLDKTIFTYSMVGEYSSAENDFVMGTHKIFSVPTFHGKVRHRDSILLIYLGFQGNRAMSIFRNYKPYRTLALIPVTSIPNWSDQKDIVYRNNKDLLANQFVTSKEISGFHPWQFHNEFKSILDVFADEENISIDNYNLVFSPIGPKPDILSIYRLVRKNDNIQIGYCLPSRYRDNSQGCGQTFIFDFPSDDCL